MFVPVELDRHVVGSVADSIGDSHDVFGVLFEHILVALGYVAYLLGLAPGPTVELEGPIRSLRTVRHYLEIA